MRVITEFLELEVSLGYLKLSTSSTVWIMMRIEVRGTDYYFLCFANIELQMVILSTPGAVCNHAAICEIPVKSDYLITWVGVRCFCHFEKDLDTECKDGADSV